jgi:hypothetical protein
LKRRNGTIALSGRKIYPEVNMKGSLTILSFLLLSTMSWARNGSEKTSTEKIFAKILSYSKDAYVLATAHRGHFQDSRLNALTSRIQDDQRVLLETIGDTERMKNLDLPPLTISRSHHQLSEDLYLDREIAIHEEILRNISKSSSPVLKNMKKRIETALSNAITLREEERQAQEDTSTDRRSP